MNMKDFYMRTLTGLIARHVARGKSDPEQVIKTVVTFVDRGRLDARAVEVILAEVESQSVRPFLAQRWNQTARLDRFQLIKGSLNKRITFQ